jgi:hypothetical protein
MTVVIYCIALSGCFQVNNKKGLRGWTAPVDDVMSPQVDVSPGHASAQGRAQVDLEKAVPELPHDAE